MLTLGHIAAAYLIAEGGRVLGVPVSDGQILGTIIAGNLPDVDFIVGLFTGKSGELHHQNITHTPLGILIIWLGILVVFKVEARLAIILLAVLLVHLFLDDLGHILAKLGIFKGTPNPQVNWLYPLTKYNRQPVIKENKEVLKHYLIKGWPVAVIELLLVLLALVVFSYGR